MPTLLQVEGLSISFGERTLFENISFVINQYQKVALIARNGVGKTSLLNIIAGVESADTGYAKLYDEGTVGYLTQDPELDEANSVFDEVYSTSNAFLKTIREYELAIKGTDKMAMQKSMEKMDAINAWEYETRIHQVLGRLKVPDLDQKIASLSGGQRKRVALAKILIAEPSLLILDEPTNHLDIEIIEWLEEYLSGPAITLLMVTHDRYFLDRVCDEILELDNRSLFRYKGNYPYFLEKRQERKEILSKEVEKARNLLRTEQEWMRRMPQARTTKSKARIDSFYEIKEKAESMHRESTMNLNMEGTRMGRKILEMHDVTFSWGDNSILKGFTYIYKRNEKVGIIGKNGCGKSTLLDIISGGVKPDKGKVETGETIRFGYYRQEGIPFKENTRVIDVVKEIAESVKSASGEFVSAATFLNYFMFPHNMHQQFVYKLSGGEKRRLYLVTILMQNPNFLLLDEPTNDLDILTLNILEEYLLNFTGCIAVVSHDRFFLDKIVDHLFVFKGDGLIKDYPGNYTQYREWKDRLQRQRKLSARSEGTKKEKPKALTTNKLSYKEKTELDSLELSISSLEEEKAAIEATLSLGSLSHEELQIKSHRFSEIIADIEVKTERWMELSEKL